MAESQRVHELVLRWHELHDVGQRPAVADLCTDCPELATEVEQRIRALDSLEQFLNVSAKEGTENGDKTHTCRISAINVPGYQIIEELGRGGMGVVYKGRHVRLNRPVALKMLLAGSHADKGHLTRFRKEADVLAKLRHPCFVHIYDIGEVEGQPYFSMELAEGGNLERKWRGRPQPPQVAAELLGVLAEAMHAAHAQGIVHRDLKPANVLLTADGTPKVTDFGLAKQMEQVGPTLSGAVIGTPSYMAPELAAGHLHDVGPRTDIYALGAILYEALTGQPPYRGRTVLEILQKIRLEEPVSPRHLRRRFRVTWTPFV